MSQENPIVQTPAERVITVTLVNDTLQYQWPIPELGFTELPLTNKESILLYRVHHQPDKTLLEAINKTSHYSGTKTQLECAKSGMITPQMFYVALRESVANVLMPSSNVQIRQGRPTVEIADSQLEVSVEKIRQEIASARAVLPSNKNHRSLAPMIIGKNFLTKVNANIGASGLVKDINQELAKLKLALQFGADTVMDLTTGIKDCSLLRSKIIEQSPVPIGTVPIYEALERANGNIKTLSWPIFRDVLIEQAEQGVDYFTIHAALSRELLHHAAQRLIPIVSRGGGIMAHHMLAHQCENMALEHFDEILSICYHHDVTISLGDGLRPGSVLDACDQAQYGELKRMGQLAKRCFNANVQCIIEGPGHVPFNKIAENQILEDQLCCEAPFYTLGPLPTDIGAGYDHICSAIGAAMIAASGASMLCYVTPTEHLGLPVTSDVKEGLIANKLAAHIADLAKGIPNAYNLDYAMSLARSEFRWADQFALSSDSNHAYSIWSRHIDEQSCNLKAGYCSMCGPRFCPMRLNKKLKGQKTSSK